MLDGARYALPYFLVNFRLSGYNCEIIVYYGTLVYDLVKENSF